MTFPILLGALLAAAFVRLAAAWRGGEMTALAIGLFIAALIYVGLALPGGDREWLLIEAAGLATFGALAWLGRATPWWLAVGWSAHVAWDVGLHVDRAQPVVGEWYPLLCVGFDLFVAGYLWRAASSPARGSSR